MGLVGDRLRQRPTSLVWLKAARVVTDQDVKTFLPPGEPEARFVKRAEAVLIQLSGEFDDIRNSFAFEDA